jgi:selenoprotein W-related protein
MANQILEELEHKIDEFTLIPGRGGVFEVVVGDELVYSKKETGEHTDYSAIAPAVRALFGYQLDDN